MNEKVSQLSGPMLDYYVAMALDLDLDKRNWYFPQIEGKKFSPTTDVKLAMELITKYHISIDDDPGKGGQVKPYAWMRGEALDGEYGDTAIEAAMRALVAHKLGRILK